MPKAEPMTAKAIGKKIKAKGLQKLKFYCQMCEKQCRDANGFKCHTQSESHQRQLLLFADNPNKYLGTYSDDFLKGFLYLLRTRFGTRKVAANAVYQEYIKDKDHIHMNATRWVTLTGLCKWMGRKGIATVEETEKGWFITYIDRDPETLKRQENKKKNEKLDKDYEERIAKIIQEQIERGKASEKNSAATETSEEGSSKNLVRSEDIKIAFSLTPGSSKSSEVSQPPVSNLLKASIKRSAVSATSDEKYKKKQSDKKTALELLKEEEERTKAKKIRRDNWLTQDIIVKIVTKKLGDQYYKSKGVVKKVIDLYEAVVELLDTHDTLKIDQKYLETVIPAIGKTVRVVNGPYDGHNATLLQIDVDKFSCKIKMVDGPFLGREITSVPYEDICKIQE